MKVKEIQEMFGGVSAVEHIRMLSGQSAMAVIPPDHETLTRIQDYTQGYHLYLLRKGQRSWIPLHLLHKSFIQTDRTVLEANDSEFPTKVKTEDGEYALGILIPLETVCSSI